MRSLLFLFLLIPLSCILANVTYGTITLGMSLTTSATPNTLAHQGEKILNGLMLWLDVINSTSREIGGQNYRFELKILEDNGSMDQIMDNYQQLMNDTEVDYLLAPVGSLASNSVSILTNANQRVLVGTSVASVDFYTSKDFSLSVVPTSTRCPTISFPYFRLRGDSRVALIISQETDPREACEGMTDKEVRNYPRSEKLTQGRIKFFPPSFLKNPFVFTFPFSS
jgi:ABC-type branched-subunit amino acid transport system substrate-binding protein